MKEAQGLRERERIKIKPTLAFHHMEVYAAMGMSAYAECGVSPAELKFGWHTPVSHHFELNMLSHLIHNLISS